MSDERLSKHDHVLAGLVFSLQAGAMQQLGKIQNQATGEVERDLEAARSTIDVLEMLKVKCRTGTPDDLLRMLDAAVMDLQLNYMDELKKDRAAAGDADAGPDDTDAGPDDTDAGPDDTDEETAG